MIRSRLQSANLWIIYDIDAKIEGYFFLDPADIEAFNKVLYESAHTAKGKRQMTFYLQKAKRVIDGVLKILESSLIELSKYRLRENADYKDFEIISSDMIKPYLDEKWKCE